jgi:chromosome partitioning protein
MIQPTPYENLNVIPSEVNLSGSEIDLAQRPDRLQVVRNVLQAIRDANVFDYILLDCPPSLGILMTSTLAAADGILVPMQAEYYALEGLGVMQNLIERLKANGANPALELNGILMTMFDARTRLSADVVEEVRGHFGDKVFETMIPRNVRTSEAPSFGQPVVFYDPSCRGSEAYRAFAREFARRNPTRVVAPEPAAESEQAPEAAAETVTEAPHDEIA